MLTLTQTLILHVLTGLIGVMASYTVLMNLLGKRFSLKLLKISSVAAAVLYVISWLTGGYYYVIRYGVEVKPVIKAGDYPWAHSFFTEAKEHLFLFMPVVAIIVAAVVFLYGDTLNTTRSVKRTTTLLAFLVVLIGTFVTVSGIIISGSVR